MKTKAEVYQEDSEKGGFWVCPCIQVGGYYKHFDKNRIHCSSQLEVSDAVWKILNKNVCPECGHVFSGNAWDGIDTHWRAHHEDIMSYENAWELLTRNKYIEVMLESAE